MASIHPSSTPVVCDGCGRLPPHGRLDTLRVPFSAVPGVEIVLTVCAKMPFCAQAAQEQARYTGVDVLEEVPEWDHDWEPEPAEPAAGKPLASEDPDSEPLHAERMGTLRRLNNLGERHPRRAGRARILSLPPPSVRKSRGAGSS